MGGTVALRGGGALLGGHVVVVASPSIVPWQLLDYLVGGQQITIATMILTVDGRGIISVLHGPAAFLLRFDNWRRPNLEGQGPDLRAFPCS